MADSKDEEELLAALRQVFDSRQEPPPEIVEAGKRIFAWHGAGKEMAQLTYDSAQAPDRGPALHDEPAGTRVVTLSSARMTIQLGFTPDAVLGQVAPPHATAITLQAGNGREKGLAADERAARLFAIPPFPRRGIRLLCQNDGDPDVLDRVDEQRLGRPVRCGHGRQPGGTGGRPHDTCDSKA